MKNINPISFKKMRNEEFRGFHSEIVQYSKKFTCDDLKIAINDYEESFNQFSDTVKTKLMEPLEHKASLLSSNRKTIYCNCRKVAETTVNIPDPELSEIGQKILFVFTSNPSLYKVNQVQGTGIVIKIIKSLREIGNENLEKCDMKVWVDRLENINNQFLEANEERHSILGNRIIKQNKTLRTKCEKDFQKLITLVNAKGVYDDEESMEFIDKTNALIKSMHLKINTRKNSKKKQEVKSDAV